MIEAGSPAPDFSLPDHEGRVVSLEGLRGRTTVLAFYPNDFSAVCTDQLNVYEEVLSDLRAAGVDLYGVSVDSAFAHKAFREHLGITIPLLADFHPKGEMAKAYGVWSEEYGVAGRCLVMVGPDLCVLWSYRSHPLEVPGPNLIFDALDAAAA